MITEWEEFLDPYIQAVGELKIKLRGIRKQYRKQNKHSPIEFVTGRVKPIESIKEKMAPWRDWIRYAGTGLARYCRFTCHGSICR